MLEQVRSSTKVEKVVPRLPVVRCKRLQAVVRVLVHQMMNVMSLRDRRMTMRTESFRKDYEMAKAMPQ